MFRIQKISVREAGEKHAHEESDAECGMFSGKAKGEGQRVRLRNVSQRRQIQSGGIVGDGIGRVQAGTQAAHIRGPVSQVRQAAVVSGYAVGQPEGSVFSRLAPGLPALQKQACPGGGVVDATASVLAADVCLEFRRGLTQIVQAGGQRGPLARAECATECPGPLRAFPQMIFKALPLGNILVREAVGIEHERAPVV